MELSELRVSSQDVQGREPPSASAPVKCPTELPVFLLTRSAEYHISHSKICQGYYRRAHFSCYSLYMFNKFSFLKQIDFLLLGTLVLFLLPQITSANWTQLSGQTSSTPAVVWDPVLNQLDTVVRSDSGSIYFSSVAQDKTVIVPFKTIGGSAAYPLSLVWNPSSNKIDIVAVSSTGSPYFAALNSDGSI